MTTIIPNCLKCGRKSGGRYDGSVGAVCKKCLNKEKEEKETDLNTIAHEVAHTELNKK